jgi:hypothetical protein
VYKLDSFVGFIGDEQLHAQECYASFFVTILGSKVGVHFRQPTNMGTSTLA